MKIFQPIIANSLFPFYHAQVRTCGEMDITTDFGSVVLGSSPGRCTVYCSSTSRKYFYITILFSKEIAWYLVIKYRYIVTVFLFRIVKNMSFIGFPHQKQRKYVKLWITLCMMFIKDRFVNKYKGLKKQANERHV